MMKKPKIETPAVAAAAPQQASFSTQSAITGARPIPSARTGATPIGTSAVTRGRPSLLGSGK